MNEKIVKKPGGYKLIPSVLLSYMVTLAFLLLLAFLMFRFQLDEKKVTVGITCTYILSCLTGGFYIGKKSGNKKFLWGLLSGVIYGLLLFGITLVMERQIDADMGQVLTAMLLCAGGGMLGGMLS